MIVPRTVEAFVALVACRILEIFARVAVAKHHNSIQTVKTIRTRFTNHGIISTHIHNANKAVIDAKASSRISPI